MFTWKELANRYDEIYSLVNSEEESYSVRYDKISEFFNLTDDGWMMSEIFHIFSHNHIGPHTESMIKELGGIEGFNEWDCDSLFSESFVPSKANIKFKNKPSLVAVKGIYDMPVTLQLLQRIGYLSNKAEDDIMGEYGYHHHDNMDEILEILGERFCDKVIEPLANTAVEEYGIEVPDPSLTVRNMEEFGFRSVNYSFIPAEIVAQKRDKIMKNYGRTFKPVFLLGDELNGEMIPLSKERAMEIYEKGSVPIYLLYDDGTEGALDDIRQFDEHKGMFGVELEDWKIAKPRMDAFDKMIESGMGL